MIHAEERKATVKGKLVDIFIEYMAATRGVADILRRQGNTEEEIKKKIETLAELGTKPDGRAEAIAGLLELQSAIEKGKEERDDSQEDCGPMQEQQGSASA